jgi:hypothetical protein
VTATRAAAPAGTLTMLFTDIEGSSNAFDQLEAMASAKCLPLA